MAAQIHWNHDVFLSFRGEDTRKTFTDHLYTALVRVGIHTFRDDDELPRGEHISTELLKAIQGSKVSIVVFSKGYASSSWCLDELVEIIRCKNSIGQTLLPIFYDVNPSDVRKQTGTFAKAFAMHEYRFQVEMERVHKWRAALAEAANYSGWDLQNVANGYESRFIEKIIEEVLCKVNNVGLDIAKHPISINDRTEKIKALLNLGKGDVHIVGIYGMGGIGKTTLAKAVYNQIYNGFEGCSCLLNIKEISEQPNGLVKLQEQLLFEVLKSKNLKIANVDRGINLIKEKFRSKRVLVILDDVDHLTQLNSLAGSSEWFGPGSRVIVTTRDEHLLTELGVHEKYKVKELNHEESLQLFSWHAFRMAHPKEDYEKLSISVVNYVRGLPLALEILGSYLSGRSTIEWKNALEKLQKYPHHRIQKILRMSFDSLDDDTVKDTFLDIACFFVGMDKDYAIKIFDGCGFFPEIGINILIQRSLVTINGLNELRMHDLIRDMGMEIVRERSSNDLGRRSRLWFHEDVLHVLSNQMGSEAVEGLILNLSILDDDVNIKTEAFAKMKNLRLLQINGANLTGCYIHLFEGLRWLCWHRCPLKFLPSNFHLENLVILDMQDSNVKEVWKEIKVLSRLKVLNLKNSKFLTKIPNFSQVPALEILILEGCTSLVELHESIGNLKRLVLLNLEGCQNLRNLPGSISNLKSLQILNLSGCVKLDKLPEQLGNMMALKKLYADKTAITQLPASFCLLKNLETLSLSGCKGQSSKSLLSHFSSWISLKSSSPTHLLPTSISGLCSLTRLNLNDCNLSEDGFPIDLGCLSSLHNLDIGRNNFLILPHCIGRLPKLTRLYLSGGTSLQSILELSKSLIELDARDCNLSEDGFPIDFGCLSSLMVLDIGRNNFFNLPHCIGRLSKLNHLTLKECSSLQSIPELPASLLSLDARGCTSIETLPNLSNLKSSRDLDFANCQKLVEIQGLESLETTPTIYLENCNNLAYNFRRSLLSQLLFKGDEPLTIVLPGSEVPSWFGHHASGCFISFELPPLSEGEIYGLVFCAVYVAKDEANILGQRFGRKGRFLWLKISNKTGDIVLVKHFGPKFCVVPKIREDHHLIFRYIPLRDDKFLMERGEELKASLVHDKFTEVKKCGIHFLFDDSNVRYGHESVVHSLSDSSS